MSTSRVTEKGQVIIPAKLRKKYDIRKGTRVMITEAEGGVIQLKPIPDDPVAASRGILKGKTSLIEALQRDRKEEAKRG